MWGLHGTRHINLLQIPCSQGVGAMKATNRYIEMPLLQKGRPAKRPAYNKSQTKSIAHTPCIQEESDGSGFKPATGNALPTT